VDAVWENGLRHLKKFKDREGHCVVFIDYKEGDFSLGQWVSRQRQVKMNLPVARRDQLNELGFVWDPLGGAWEQAFKRLVAFKNRDGHCRVPDEHVESGFKLGKWVGKQRAKKRMSPEQRQRLTELGFVWDPSSDQWEKGFHFLKQYRHREKHCRVHPRYEESGFKLGVWVTTQRHSKKPIPLERRRQLDDLGFVWDPLEADWEQGFTYLVAFKNKTGHCVVPQPFELEGFALGRWVSKQRLNADKMSDERRERLAGIGFIWQPRDAA
jgi:Helicase associated domain